MKTEYPKGIKLYDREDVRNIVATKVNTFIRDIDPLDILLAVETDTRINKIVSKLGGNVDTNPLIAKFDRKILKLIKLSLENMRRQNRKFIPLYII